MILRSFTVALAVLLGGLPVLGQSAEQKKDNWIAVFDQPVARYGHEIMGDVPEWSRLCLSNGTEKTCITLPETSIFEDIQPRLVDVDQDGQPEIVVVETDENLGAALAIYDLENGRFLKTATPNIGTRYRWLAPIGAADFNGDGHMDVAYVDRPHLAKTLRVWTYRDGGLTEIAAIGGVTNHTIGEPFITSDIRNCNGLSEMILTDANRKNVVSVFFKNGKLKRKILGEFNGLASVETPPIC